MASSTLHRSARFRPASVAPAARRNPLELLLLQLQGKKASGGGAALLAAWLAGCGSRSCCITASSSDRERDLRIPVSLPAVPRASPGRSLQSERSRSSPPLVPAAAVKKPGADFSFLPRSPRGGGYASTFSRACGTRACAYKSPRGPCLPKPPSSCAVGGSSCRAGASGAGRDG